MATPEQHAPPDSEFAQLEELAQRAARAAGSFVTELLGTRTRAVLRTDAGQKSSRTDLVTEADRRSEQLVTATLLAQRPDDSILGEETGARQGSSDITWIIDPLDGTTNFVYDFGSFAVSIAAVHDGRSIVGVVHDPVREETFSAIAGGGAFRNGAKLHIPLATPSLGDALIGTGFGYAPSRRQEQAELLTVVLPLVRDIRRAGAAALDLCYVADGRLDAYYEAGLQPWDRAAGLLVATESGATYGELDDLVVGATTLIVGPEPLRQQLTELLIKAAKKRSARSGEAGE